MIFQVKESKRQFIFDMVNKGGEKEKMELFVNFCEDTIFEMQLAAQISGSDREEEVRGAEEDGTEEKKEKDEDVGVENCEAEKPRGSSFSSKMRKLLRAPLYGVMMLISLLSVGNLRKCMKKGAFSGVVFFFKNIVAGIIHAILGTFCFFFHIFYLAFLSGWVIDFAKEIKLSELFGDLREPTLDEVTGIGEGFAEAGDKTHDLSSESSLRAVNRSAASRNPQLLTDVFGLRLRKEGGRYTLLTGESSDRLGDLVDPSTFQVRKL